MIYENRNRESVSSGLLYLIMTHLGTALITVAFIILWLHTPGDRSFDFSAFRGLGAGAVPDASRSLAFVLLLIGFGTKAGLVPLHVWLPQAHPAAPSNVSAMMSGVMLRPRSCSSAAASIPGVVDSCGARPSCWLLASALVASLRAHGGDIKRALAFSTVENVGLIFIGLGRPWCST